jgi:hypothetical protein
MKLAPRNAMENAARQAGPWLPTVQSIAKELRRLPDAEFVEVRDADQHVIIRTQGGKLLIDVESPDETVHVACPLATIEHISEEISDLRTSDGSGSD